MVGCIIVDRLRYLDYCSECTRRRTSANVRWGIISTISQCDRCTPSKSSWVPHHSYVVGEAIIRRSPVCLSVEKSYLILDLARGVEGEVSLCCKVLYSSDKVKSRRRPRRSSRVPWRGDNVGSRRRGLRWIV